MGAAETISTHTVKNDATTTIVTRTTTIVSEHEEVLAEPKEHGHSVVENVRQTLRDYWFPSHAPEEEDDEPEEPETHQDPSLFRGNSVMRRAYDYWKTLTQDADQAAKDMVIQAKRARDEAAIEAKWAFLGYKKEAREAYEEADKKYREALAFAERVHEEAHEKAKSKWFQAVDTTEREVGDIKDQASEVTHKKWDQFKSAVNSLAFNPPKYGCSPSSQYWFSRQNPAADSGWDCREIWDHPSRHDHRHHAIKTLPKKHLSIDRVHDTLTSLLTQAGHKARNAPSATSFESHLKPVRDQYQHVLDRVARNEEGALEELDAAAVQDASDSFSSAVKEAEVKIKAAPKHAYDHALDTFHRDTAHLKAKLEQAASTASKSASSASHRASKSGASVSNHASKSGASALHEASKSASSLSHHASKSLSSKVNQVTGDAKNFVDEAQRSASSKYQEAADKARSGYEHATASASSLWGSATPHSTLHKVQHSYHKAIGNVHSHWFGDHIDNEMSASSVYGALLAIYFLFLANRIWRSRRLSRMADPSDKTFNVVKNGHAGDETIGNNKHANGDHATATIETYKRKSSAEDALEKERNSFGTVLVQFTSVVPVTLILLVLLELAGFSRVALHTLFVGLITSQLLQGGLLNDLLMQMGIVDGVHASGRDIGTYLSWAVLGLAAVANAIKVLHD
ncbi:hypothetical protein BGZ68_005548 [Mortierella alpina]|nr:hypothetical protein BGZ68_005548 [Mortierella alpina]